MGKITIGVGTPEQRDINLASFVKAEFKEGRLITVLKLEDNSVAILIQNPESSGRAVRQELLLTKESFAGLMASCYLLSVHSTDMDFGKMIEDAVNGDDVEYIYSEESTEEE